MKLSFQVPFPNLDDFIGEQDFFYALAHLVLMDDKYRDFFVGRPTMLDNGLHENGFPIKSSDLLDAYHIIKPDVLIPPDFFFDAEGSIVGFLEMANLLGSVEHLYPVVHGKSWKELMRCYETYLSHRVKGVCWPYRIGMARTLMIPNMANNIRHHFLGVGWFNELVAIRFAPNASLDTGKPFRYAQVGLPWSHENDLMKLPKLDMELQCDVQAAKESIAGMKRI